MRPPENTAQAFLSRLAAHSDIAPYTAIHWPSSMSRPPCAKPGTVKNPAAAGLGFQARASRKRVTLVTTGASAPGGAAPPEGAGDGC